MVAPLDWGLGHATRCIPIINNLIIYGFEPIIASDGGAFELLKKEFPNLKAFELPSYNISYPKKGKNLKLKLFKNSYHILNTIRKEKKYVNQLVESEAISGIISDNRFGVRHSNIPSIYITHQLNVLSGNTTYWSSLWHQHIINKFDKCWVPDFETTPNLSGFLGHTKQKLNNVCYIGPISRFEKVDLEITTDLLVVLSGPEPQRTQLENKLLHLLKGDKRKIIIVRGLVEVQQKITRLDNIEIYNYMTSLQLESSINSSKLVVSRSGYTTVMDLAKLGKKAIFIPTPGQFEQIYISKLLTEDFIIPSVSQDKLTKKDLIFSDNFSGFTPLNSQVDYETLFSLF